jgi:hypothetical protein
MKPILFNTEMIQALLDGRKVQTRRLVKPQPFGDECFGICTYSAERSDVGKIVFGTDEGTTDYIKPLYSVGDVLYVRETWYYENHMHDMTDGEPDLSSGKYSHRYIYRASNPDYPVNVGVGQQGWHSPATMPKEAARIFLRVTGVRVERLKEILRTDAIAEGFYVGETDEERYKQSAAYRMLVGNLPIAQFTDYWNSLNAKKQGCSCEDNPWIIVYEFKQITKEESKNDRC